MDGNLSKKTRNPKWSRDEIILALDLYFRIESRHIHPNNPEIIELSIFLNQLSSLDKKVNAEKFRNPNGVGLKLGNFLAIDPTYSGKGMASFSKLDEQVFWEFNEDRLLLKQLATSIRKTVTNQDLVYELRDELENWEDSSIEVKEGQVLFKLHKYRERNRAIIEKKKQSHLKKHGTIACELCNFDFEKSYGELGKGFIECHHKTPLAELDSDTKTTLNDLMLICSNCHRMVHRGWKQPELFV